MVTMFLQSAYSFVDGLFVSNLIGETALSAINVVWPVIAVVTAVGTGVGCGGAVLMSVKQGEGKEGESDLIRANTLILLLTAGAITTALFFPILRPLLRWMGADGELLELSVRYGQIMAGGGIIQVLSCGLTPMLRNDGRAVTAMAIMVSGLVVNLALDYVLMAWFHLGVEGAAAASLAAQGVTALSCLLILFLQRRNPLRPAQFQTRPAYWKRVLWTAVSPFGISLAPSLLILAHNVACLASGDDLAVAAYALISSTVGSCRILLIGVAEGIQPLASYAHGAGDIPALRRIRNKAVVTALAVSVGLFLFTVATARWYPALYGYTDSDAIAASYRAVMLTAPQLIFTGLVRVTNSFFYAIGKNRYSLFMIYFDPLVLTPVMLALLMGLLGTDGIWLNAVVTQLALNLAALWMFRRHEKELKKLEGDADKGGLTP